MRTIIICLAITFAVMHVTGCNDVSEKAHTVTSKVEAKYSNLELMIDELNK